MRLKGILKFIAGSTAMFGLLAQASAQVPEIRLAKQFSMGYLQLNVMDHHKLIEKHAKLMGIPEVKVVWQTFNGPSAMNDALLSGNIDIASGGVPGLLVAWGKTKGTPQEIRGVTALSSQPVLLNTRLPNVKTIADFKDGDKIAVPAVKSSVQAITLQMAAARLWGAKEFAKLDPLTVSMSPPDSTIALLSGSSEIKTVFSVPPFQFQQLENADIHTVTNSFDIMNGSHTFTVAWTTAKFRDGNPVLYKALIAALKEATDIINKDKPAAGKLWIEDSKSKLSPDMVGKIVAGPQVHWTMTPEHTMKYADFMHDVGTIKPKAASWKDYFFPEIHDLKGSCERKPVNFPKPTVGMLPNDRLDYSAIPTRKPLKLPNGARMVVWTVTNVEEWDPTQTMPRTVLTPPAGGSPMPDIPNWCWHEYGNRVGFWRLLQVYDEFKIPGVMNINGVAVEAFPDIVKACVDRKWEFVGHGYTQRNMQKVENERADIRKCIEVLEKATSKKPRGWLGPGLTETWETPDILAEEGYDYVADWVLDDQPVWMKTRGKPILNIPYTQECNDVAMMLIQHHKASEFYERAMDQFEQIYKDAKGSARVMAISVHPYIMGAPHRAKYFRQIFQKIRKKKDVLFWTGAQIADWYKKVGPKAP